MTLDERAHDTLVYAQRDGRNMRDYVLAHLTAAVTEERERTGSKERALLSRTRLLLDHLHRDGINKAFIQLREDIAEHLGMVNDAAAIREGKA